MEERVILRSWREEDAGALARIIGNKKIQDRLRDGIPYPYTEEDGLVFIREMLAADREMVYAYAIVADGRLAGSIALFRQGNIHRRTGEVGYYLGEEFWGRGIGSRALALLCDKLFQETDLLRIYAEPFAENSASCRILEKNGFRCEGTMRQNALKNGRILDMKLYALLRAEWEDARRITDGTSGNEKR